MNILNKSISNWSGREDSVACSFIIDGRVIDFTYSELLSRSIDYSRKYISENIRPGDVIVIILHHRPELIFSFLGAIWIGAIPSFMAPPSEKQDEEYYLSGHSRLFYRIGARLVVADFCDKMAGIPFLENLPTPFLDIASVEIRVSSPASFPPPVEGKIAFLQHSSGTTDMKKGVALSHDAVMAQIDAYQAKIQTRPGETIVSWLPLYHDMGLISCFIMPFVSGVRTVLLSPFEWVHAPFELLDVIERFNGRYVWLPNFSFNHIVRTRPPDTSWDLSRVRAFINCSEPCKMEAFERFVSCFADCGVREEQMQACYAMAEMVFAVSQTAMDEAPRWMTVDAQRLSRDGLVVMPDQNSPTIRIVSCGRPIDGVQIRVVDENGEDRTDGQVGEIAVSGPSLFSGYYRQPELSSQQLRGGWYFTGDLGFINEGEVFITGRKRDVIIVHGKKFHGYDIEQIVSAISGVKPGRCSAFGIYNETVGSEEAVIVAETLRPPDASLRSIIKKEVYLELGLVLADVRFVLPGWISKTTSGKIDRINNRDKYLKETTYV